MQAYLDNAATTKVLPQVREVMVKVLEEDFGNPSSKHTKGMEAEQYIRSSKDIISRQLKCQPGEIIFTSGGTESNNQALIGAALANHRKGKHIITTRIEHPSVLEPLAYLEEQGFTVTYLPVDQYGHVDPSELQSAIQEDTILVSIMHVNNEVGAVMDLEALGSVIKQQDSSILFHVDGIQGFGKYKIIPKKYQIDLMSVSGHKIHGPKGSGFLYIKDKTKIHPIIFGGGQQKGMRSGTENVPAIAGMGEAVRQIYSDHSTKVEHLYHLKKQLIDGLSQLEGVTIHAIGDQMLSQTAPHIVSAGFSQIKSEVLLHGLEEKGVYVSSGSACSSNHPQLSGTLQAVGVSEELLDSTLRFSFSTMTTSDEISYAIQQIAQLLPVLRRFVRH